MSDFDKEAERKKLREKFEKEEEKRKTTEQMSELLLKGATMTNAHCSDCGDPIFRYDGQEFCPTCQKPITREPNEDAADDDGHIEVADPSDEARVQFGRQEPDAEDEPGEPHDETPDPEPTPDQPTQSADAGPDSPEQSSPPAPHETEDRTGPTAAGDERPRNIEGSPLDSTSHDDTSERSRSDSPSVSPRTSEPTTPEGDVQADLTASERLLARTVRQFAERAATTENPRRAKEHLEAAREAAEALDAVSF